MTRTYAEGSRRDGELSTREAAERLGVHPRTVREWAKEAISGNERRLTRDSVRQDLLGRYWLDGDAVEHLPADAHLSDYY